MTAPADGPRPPSLRPPPLQARTLLIVVATVVILAWLVVLLVDGFDLGDSRDWRATYLWQLLFNDRPIEWLQWFALAALAVGGAYTAGRLTATKLPRERAFWFLIAVGAGLMLIEDAGNIRHLISADVRANWGDQPFGIPVRVLVDLPYFAALAAVPVYALLRHGPVIWTHRRVRPYLATGFALYALAAAGSGIRSLGADRDDDSGSLYSRLGEQLNSVLGIERLPMSDLTEARFHFLLIDGMVEESLELLAVAALLASLLAFVATVSSRTGALADAKAAPAVRRKND